MSFVRYVGVLSVAALVGVFANGCSSDDNDSTSDGGSTDAATDTKRDTGTSKPDASNDTGSGCAPADVSNFTPPNYKPARPGPGACLESTWVVQFYEDCIGASSTNEKCADWVQGTEEKQACAACIFTDPKKDPNWGPLLIGNGIVSVNLGGCMEVADKSAAGLDCAKKVQANFLCGGAACDANCEVVDEETFMEYQDCLDEAAVGGCKQYSDAANACSSAQADGGAASECFNAPNFQALYAKVANIMCGPVEEPGDDAGVSN